MLRGGRAARRVTWELAVPAGSFGELVSPSGELDTLTLGTATYMHSISCRISRATREVPAAQIGRSTNRHRLPEQNRGQASFCPSIPSPHRLLTLVVTPPRAGRSRQQKVTKQLPNYLLIGRLTLPVRRSMSRRDHKSARRDRAARRGVGLPPVAAGHIHDGPASGAAFSARSRPPAPPHRPTRDRRCATRIENRWLPRTADETDV